MAFTPGLGVVVLLLVSLCVLAETDHPDEGTLEKVKSEVLFRPENCEREAKRLDLLSMHYTGTLTATGAKFDSSLDRSEPFEFQLGVGQVIKGWDESLVGICIGEKRKLMIPARLAYGEAGAGELVPPNSDLTFEVEVLSIKDGNPPENMFKKLDKNGDSLISQEEVANFLKEQSGPESQISDDQHKTIISQIFEHEDKDKDGYISHEEFSGPKHDEL